MNVDWHICCFLLLFSKREILNKIAVIEFYKNKFVETYFYIYYQGFSIIIDFLLLQKLKKGHPIL